MVEKECSNGFYHNNKCITKDNIKSEEIIGNLDKVLDTEVIHVGPHNSYPYEDMPADKAANTRVNYIRKKIAWTDIKR